MLIILYICSSAVAHNECNDKTARAVIRQHVESVMCGVPSQYTSFLTAESGPKENEYVRVRCQIR